jgi:hypothetical protein
MSGLSEQCVDAAADTKVEDDEKWACGIHGYIVGKMAPNGQAKRRCEPTLASTSPIQRASAGLPFVGRSLFCRIGDDILSKRSFV